MQKAQRAYSLFIDATIYDREAIVPKELMPQAWKQLDSWMRPKLIEAALAHVKEMVAARARQNVIDQSHVVLFYVMKVFAPGNADEKGQLMASIMNPDICTNPR